MTGNGCDPGQMIWYEADILIVACSLSVRIDEALVGSASLAPLAPSACALGLP